MAIVRTPMIDDDGSGTTGTIINNQWKVELYDQIDAALAGAVAANGTWTPTLLGDSGGGQVYATQAGWYCKTGTMVTVGFDVSISNRGTLAGTLYLGGLPFAPGPMAHGVNFAYWAGLAVGVVSMSGFIGLSGSRVVVQAVSAPVTTNPNTTCEVLLTPTSGRIGGVFSYSTV